MQNNFVQMRDLMTLTERCLFDRELMLESEPETEAPVPDEAYQTLLDDLEQLAFKLRAHAEDDDGDRSAGIEAGMSRAADMIENLVNRRTA